MYVRSVTYVSNMLTVFSMGHSHVQETSGCQIKSHDSVSIDQCGIQSRRENHSHKHWCRREGRPRKISVPAPRRARRRKINRAKVARDSEESRDERESNQSVLAFQNKSGVCLSLYTSNRLLMCFIWLDCGWFIEWSG